ncbi:hypothetical protein E2562_013480 [Oryza meyeriana var. granulata]|uniref:Uncharacterized protein n=1 Tax=Oryza meyeriana var. granulata TaxID=110450 RepID=A0A6G1BVS1_9ORYZ|nr:hypothetical protein E2562_013480 [Oryza meyeriana var. granulata]
MGTESSSRGRAAAGGQASSSSWVKALDVEEESAVSPFTSSARALAPATFFFTAASCSASTQLPPPAPWRLHHGGRRPSRIRSRPNCTC